MLLLNYFCRIIYNSGVRHKYQPPLVGVFWQLCKAVGAVILSILVLLTIYALIWGLCALDDVCYYKNYGV